MAAGLETEYLQVITASGRDISARVNAMIYEDCTDSDDLFQITLPNCSPADIDHPDFQEKAEITFRFGYAGGAVSPARVMIVTGQRPDYGKTITLTVKASDGGPALKKSDSAQTYENLTGGQIAAQIAKKLGYTPMIESGTTKHESIAQGNRTDMDFLRYLAEQEPGGNWRIRIKEKTLFFERLNLNKPAARTFTYNGGGTVFSFTPQTSDTTKKGEGDGVTAVGVDPATGATVSGGANPATAANARLGDYARTYNANGQEIGRTGSGSAGRTVPVPPTANGSGAANTAAAAQQEAALGEITADLKMKGNPYAAADEIITMAGVGKKYGGNYYVAKVRHTLQRGGAFTTAYSLLKNGTNQATGSEKGANVNKAAGPESTTQKKAVKVYNYDDQGREL